MNLRRLSLALLGVAAFLGVSMVPATAAAHVSPLRDGGPGSAAALPASAALLVATQVSADVHSLVSSNTLGLSASIDELVVASGGAAGAALIELDAGGAVNWSYDGDAVFTAASTYKLAALMMEAQGIAAGTIDPNGVVCFEDTDYESGWFDDYADGECFTRATLAMRAGQYSDNTAGHMLVRDVGGADALNAWAAVHGATHSVFFTDNTTTAHDLGALWDAEASGRLGGSAAQGWLYPLLTHTATESGIPAGVPRGMTVVHKTGEVDDVIDDAAMVEQGPRGAYILTVMTSGLGGDAGWQLVASISQTVFAFEQSRAV